MFLSFADLMVYKILGLSSESALGNALHFFVYDVFKILSLLFLIITLISFFRSHINHEKLKNYINRKSKFWGYLLASLLGALTPFCSCSSVPIFIGLVNSGIPFGITMTFLITSPLINEIAIFTLAGIIGIKLTLLYTLTGISVGIFGGILMEKFEGKKYLQDYLTTKKPSVCCCSAKKTTQKRNSLSSSMFYAKDLIKKIWLFVIIGIMVGAFVHGYIPKEFFLTYMKPDNVFIVPLMVIIGIPLYADITTLIPISQVLIQKGMAIGTVLVFMMATVGLSLPEMIILSKVMKKELIWRFALFMFLTLIFIGYYYNWIIS